MIHTTITTNFKLKYGYILIVYYKPLMVGITIPYIYAL